MNRLEKKANREFKVVLLGETNAGKTSVANRYISNQFGTTRATIGAAFFTKNVKLKNTHLVLQIWDTAGQEKFRSMTPLYYRGADVALIVFDSTSSEALLQVKYWVSELRKVQPVENSTIVGLIGTKIDLLTKSYEQTLLYRTMTDFAIQHSTRLWFTSAKTGQNIALVFDQLAFELAQNLSTETSPSFQRHSFSTPSSCC